MPTVSVPAFFRLYGLSALLPAVALATTIAATRTATSVDVRPSHFRAVTSLPSLVLWPWGRGNVLALPLARLPALHGSRLSRGGLEVPDHLLDTPAPASVHGVGDA